MFFSPQELAYSLESSLELLEKDVVQLHAPRYQSMRKASHVCLSISLGVFFIIFLASRMLLDARRRWIFSCGLETTSIRLSVFCFPSGKARETNPINLSRSGYVVTGN